MGLYSEYVLPHVIDKACSMGRILGLRQTLVAQAEGTVLEVGMGSGINLQFYEHSRVERVYGLEPSEGMRRKAEANLKRSPVSVEWLSLPGEEIPLPDQSIDTVVLTFTLCTIPDWRQALGQMHRVLKPAGKLLFLEHGESPDDSIRQWQHRLTPGWKRLAGGCHLNRPISELIRGAGFELDRLETFYLRGAPRFAGYLYLGSAQAV